MLKITKVIEWDMGHRVPNHKNKCSNPHGHRYRLEVTITGEIISEKGLSSEGMIHDFGDIKKIIMESIHDIADHSFMLYDKDPFTTILKNIKNIPINLVVVPFIPTAENIVKWCYKKIQKQLPGNLKVYHCRLYETPKSWADYGSI